MCSTELVGWESHFVRMVSPLNTGMGNDRRRYRKLQLSKSLVRAERRDSHETGTAVLLQSHG